MEKKPTNYFFEMNLAMILVGSSGALGKYIALSPIVTIWTRSFLAVTIMILFCVVNRYSFKISSKKDFLKIVLSSFFLAIHWVLYFYSLRLTNVAIGMLTLFTYPLFTTLLEPLVFKTKWSISHLICSLLVFLGLYFLLPSFDLENKYTFGICVGLVSSVAYTIRNLILKTQVSNYNGSVLMTYQLLCVTLFLSPFLNEFKATEVQVFIVPLLTLALLTTAIGHTLFLRTFSYFSISVASILSSLQPIYGIAIAYVFLHETPNTSSIVGGVLILSTVVYTGWMHHKTTS